MTAAGRCLRQARAGRRDRARAPQHMRRYTEPRRPAGSPRPSPPPNAATPIPSPAHPAQSAGTEIISFPFLFANRCKWKQSTSRKGNKALSRVIGKLFCLVLNFGSHWLLASHGDAYRFAVIYVEAKQSDGYAWQLHRTIRSCVCIESCRRE